MIKVKSFERLEKLPLFTQGGFDLALFADYAGKYYNTYEKEKYGYTVLHKGVYLYIPADAVAFEV